MTAWSPISSNTAACGMARAGRRCRLGGTNWSAVVITTAVGTSTSAIHSCEVNSTADSTADMAAGRLVLESCARAHARDSSSWMRPSRLLPNHSAVIACANGIRHSALFDKSRVGPEVVLYQRFSGGHDDGDVGDTGSDEFAHGVFDNRLVSGNISFGMAFVNGSSREPRPAAESRPCGSWSPSCRPSSLVR